MNRTSSNKWKEKFLTEILKSESEKSTHFNVLTEEKYLSLLHDVEEAKKLKKKTTLQQRRLKRFDVVKINGIKKLIARNEAHHTNIKLYLLADELYDVIDAAHVAVGHGGRDKMLAETSKNYANVTTEMICLFLSMCKVCKQKKTKKKKAVVSNDVFQQHSIKNSRCHVDLIDFQAQPDEKFKFVMVYQEHLTKFVVLRALESNEAKEVADHLSDVFSTFGAPCILHSDNGQEFVKHVIFEVTSLWPELKILSGKVQHYGQASRNGDIEDMVSGWMDEKKTSKWSEGLKYVQFMRNRSFHSEIKQSPYMAMFGVEPSVGLSTTLLPLELLNNIKSEDDLQEFLDGGIDNKLKNEVMDVS